MRPTWKEHVDSAIFSLEEAHKEDLSQGGGYTESQYAAAFLEALAKRMDNNPYGMVDCLSKTRHLIDKALEQTYAKHRKILGSRPYEKGIRRPR